MDIQKCELILEETFSRLDDVIKICNEINMYSSSLNVIVLSDDPASASYVKNKVSMGAKYGVIVNVIQITDVIELIKTIEDLKSNCQKVIVQCPYDQNKFIKLDILMSHIDKFQDVDGFAFNYADIYSIKSFRDMLYHPNFSPTAKFAIALLANVMSYRADELKGANVTVIGQGLTSGLPISTLLSRLGCTVTWINSNTSDNKQEYIIENSDYIISCAGVPNLISKDGLHSKRPYAVYINIGMARDESGRLQGDINYDVSELPNTYYVNKTIGSTGKGTTMALILNTLL